MAQPPHLPPPSSSSRSQRNCLDDRGVQEPPDDSTIDVSSSRPPTTTMEESPGHLTTSDTNTTSSSNPNRPQRWRQRMYNRRILPRPLSTPSPSPSRRWSFTTFRHARQQLQQHHQLLQRNGMATTMLKRRTFPPLSHPHRIERHRFSHPSNKMSRWHYYVDEHGQGSHRRHRRNSLSALFSTWRISGSLSRLHRLSVRSSMILPEGIPTSDIPEVLYDDDGGHDEGSSWSSFGDSTCTRCANDERCPRHPPQRQRLYTLKKGGSGSCNKAAGMLVCSSEKFMGPPTISSISSSLSVLVVPHHQQRPLQYQQDLRRFSAFWYDGVQRKSGKHQVHVDNLGQVRQNNKQCQNQVQSALFLFGFLVFPLWWIGAWLHCRTHTRTKDPEKRQQPQKNFDPPQSSSLSLIDARVLGKINCCMTCMSLVIMAVMIALGVWLLYGST